MSLTCLKPLRKCVHQDRILSPTLVFNALHVGTSGQFSSFSHHSLSYQILNYLYLNTPMPFYVSSFCMSTFWNNFPSFSWLRPIHSPRLNLCIPSSGKFSEKVRSPSSPLHSPSVQIKTCCSLYLSLILLVREESDTDP